MHELAVTNTLIQLILRECTDRKITSPKKIYVDLGNFTSYSKESILFYYDMVRRDFPLLSKSELLINEVPSKIRCKDCKKISTLEDMCMICCPVCQSTNLHIVSGKEFILRKIEATR
jgi:hydrogenase nickel incorporation protein HypA/HybF